MNGAPRARASIVELLPGVSALPSGVLWLHGSRTLVAADVHLAYEDVIGGALPMWSTPEITGTLSAAARRMNAAEIVLLGDVIHGSRMSEGAARAVRESLDGLRGLVQLTLVAGNHEGRSRGAAILGDTVEFAERDGWLLLHGDKPPCHSERFEGRAPRCIIGHLHPSLGLGGGMTAPAFLSSPDLVVVPAMTPYSRGLDVFSGACLSALAPFGIESRGDLQVVVAAGNLLYPFGTLSRIRAAMRARRI
jgi:metallophosphoesterase superfamily enzyme